MSKEIGDDRTIDGALLISAIEKLEHELIQAQRLTNARDEAMRALSAINDFVSTFEFMREKGLKPRFSHCITLCKICQMADRPHF